MSAANAVAADDLAERFQTLSIRYGYSWGLYENLGMQHGLNLAVKQPDTSQHAANIALAPKPLARTITIDEEDEDIVFQPRAKATLSCKADSSDVNVVGHSSAFAAAVDSDDEEDDSVIDRRLQKQRLDAADKLQKRSRYIEQEAQLSGSEGSGDEEECDEDEYDYDDGFLVSDGDDSASDRDQGSADEEEAEEEEGDGEGEDAIQNLVEDEEEEVQALATPALASRPPVAPTNSARIKGRAKQVTVAQPFNLSTATRCAACAAGTHGHGQGRAGQGAGGSCEYAKLRDGDADPRSGLIFIREEYEAGLRSLGSGGHHHSQVPASPAQTPSGTVRHAFRNKAQRDTLTARLYAEYDRRVFGGALGRQEGANGYVPAVPVEWGARLTKTAGMTYTKKSMSADGRELVYSARISLSVKVLDSPLKLAQTLLHEMCHAAAWLVDHSIRPPHGAVFQAWARRATAAYPSRAVTVCHNYEIAHKYNYVCQNESCGYTYGRHSKSIDTARQRCGACAGQGRLVLVVAGMSNATPAKGDGLGSITTPVRQQSDYQRFIAAERLAVIQAMPGASQPVILAECARRWQVRKAALRSLSSASAEAPASPHGGERASSSLAAGMTPVLAARAARSGLLGGTGNGCTSASAGMIDLTGATPTAMSTRTYRRQGEAAQAVIELDHDAAEAAAGSSSGTREERGQWAPADPLEGGADAGTGHAGDEQVEEQEESEDENEAPGHVSPEPTYSKRKPVHKTSGASPTEKEEEESTGLLGGLMRRLSSALNLS